MTRDTAPAPEGLVRVHTVDESPLRHYPSTVFGRREIPGNWKPVHADRWKHNLAVYEWAAVVGNLLLRKGLQYGISYMLFEFENTASPGDPVDPPTLSRDAEQGVDYYLGLVDSSDRDYLRVPIIAGRLDISDATKFPKGNEAVFFAQTSGVEGVNGKPFGPAYNSRVFGGALVAAVDEADPTQDLVLSRFYADTDEQIDKADNIQIGYEWIFRLK